MPNVASRLDSLNPQQRQAAAHPGGPLLILAGAGTGKTRVITHRIAHLISEAVPAGRILAVTFTNKAAEEMRHRVEALVPGQGRAVWVCTFHAFASRLLRQHSGLLKIPSSFTIYNQDDQKKLVQQALKELEWDTQKNKASLFVSLISRAKDDLLDPDSYAIHAAASGEPFRQTLARIYKHYQGLLAKSGGLDFGDLLMKAVELLRDHPSVREYYQELFLHSLVDEYQDTNHAQYVLVKALAAKHRNLCVVGDDDQSIYEFRGANIRNIMEFEKDFPDAKVVKLEQNYRSTQSILSAATRVIGNNRYRKEKTLWTQRSSGDPVRAMEVSNETEEARWVVQSIQRLAQEDKAFSDIAVFYRTNAQSRSFEEALRVARIPYTIVGAIRFYERKEIKDVLAYARVLVNPRDSISLSRILNVPSRGIGKTTQEALEKFTHLKGITLQEALVRASEISSLSSGAQRAVREFASLLENLRTEALSLPVSQAMLSILSKTSYVSSLEEEADSDPEAASRLDNIQELVNAMKEFEERAKKNGEAADLQSYLENVALQMGADDYDRSASRVTLMTVHLAKGLEFPVVFLTGLEEGLFPIGAGNSSAEELEEERRLCYVGMTRAKEQLYLTYAATRRLFGQTYSNLASRFILEAGLLDSKLYSRPSAPEPAPTRSVVSGFRVGMRVNHPEYGSGRVVEKSGSGETLKVTVLFDKGGSRKFLARYAPLEVLR